MRSERTVRMSSGLLTLCLGGAVVGTVVGVVAHDQPVYAAGDITAIVLDGEPGDQISHGRSLVYDDFDHVNADVRDPEYPGGVRMSYWVDGGPTWSVMIRAPQGTALTAGTTYTDATNGGNVEPGQPELVVDGGGRSCYLTQGSFTVHEITTDWYELLSFSASFKQLCNNSTGWMYGEIRYNASDGYKAAVMPSSGLDFGRHETKSRSETKSVTITSAGTSALHLGTSQLVGDDPDSFRIESDTCSGTTLAPGESCAIAASAMPLSTRALTARVTIADDTHRGKKAVVLDAVGFKDYAWGSVGTAGRNYTWTGGEALAYTEGAADRIQQVNVAPRINGKWAKDGGPWIGVFHARKGVMGSRWSTAKRINQAGMHGIRPALAASGESVYAVWVGTKKYVPYQPKAPRVLYFRANGQGGKADSWRAITRLTSKSGRVDSPSIAADGSNVYVTWTNADSGKVWLAISRDKGKRWTKRQIATTASKGTSGYYAYPVIAADQDNLIVAWWPRKSALMKVKVSTDGGRSWSGAAELGYASWHPSVAAKGGRLAVAWPSGRKHYLRTWDGGWEPTREIDVTGKKTFTPALVLRGEDAMAIAYPLCHANCSFDPRKTTEVALKWRYSADRGKSWTKPATLANKSKLRNVNSDPSMVWPDGGRRAVLFDGCKPYKSVYRVYLVQGPTLDPSSAGFTTESDGPTEAAPDYDDREPGGRSTE